jgi:hypothetical protein
MPHEHKASDVSFEHRDIRWAAVIFTGLGIFFGMLATAVLLWPYFEYLKTRNPAPAPRAEIAESYRDIRQPLLQTSPRADLQRLRAREDYVLKGANGDRMSIERAMKIVADRGLPPLGQAPDLKLWQPRAGSRLSGFDRERNVRRQE